MPYDDYEDLGSDTEELLEGLRKDVRRAAKKAEASQDQSLKNDERMIEAFTRVAQAMEALTKEVKGLREDINPSMDKPKKLPQPAAGG